MSADRNHAANNSGTLRSRRRFAALVALFLVASPLAAQYMERVEVSIANVDVVVTDRKGDIVRGLTRDDFEIFENGKPQTITNFAAFDVPPAVASDATGAPSVQTPARRRLVVLFLDIEDMEPPARKQFFDGVRAFLEASVREHDAFAVLTWNHRLRITLPPTTSREALESVIRAYSGFAFNETELKRRLAAIRVQEAAAEEAMARAAGMEPMTTEAEEQAFQDWMLGEERCARITRKLREMRNLLASLSRAELQKILVFASDDLSLRPGGPCVPSALVDDLANTANAYGITIHAVHPPGFRTKYAGPEVGRVLPKVTDPPASTTEYRRALDEASGLLWLARKTGGHNALGPVQSAAVLQRVAAEADTYYSLGYRLSEGREDRPRDVKVTTKNRAYRVRARTNVVRMSESARLKDLVTTNLYLPPLEQSQSPRFTAAVKGSRREGRFLLVDVELSIPASEVTAVPKGNETRVSFSAYVAAGRELGDASDVTEIKYEFKPPADPRALLRTQFTTRIRPDTRRLSVALRDNVTGSVSTALVDLPR